MKRKLLVVFSAVCFLAIVFVFYVTSAVTITTTVLKLDFTSRQWKWITLAQNPYQDGIRIDRSFNVDMDLQGNKYFVVRRSSPLSPNSWLELLVFDTHSVLKSYAPLKTHNGQVLQNAAWIAADPSGRCFWTVRGFEDNNAKGSEGASRSIIAAHSINGLTLQEWALSVPPNELALTQCVTNGKLYVWPVTSPGEMLMYHLGQSKCAKIPFNITDGMPYISHNGSLVQLTSSNGTYQIYTRDMNRREKTQINTNLSTSRAPRAVIYDYIDGTTFLFTLEEKSPRSDKLLWRIDSQGTTERFGATNEFLSSGHTSNLLIGQLIKANKNNSIWIEVLQLDKSGRVNIKRPFKNYQIVKVQRLPRWRAWWNSLTSQ